MKCLTTILFFLFFFNDSFGQDVKNDLMRLEKQDEKIQASSDVKRKKSFNPLSIVYEVTLGFYQKQISPQWGANCAYEITCSRFSRQLVQEFGLAKGFFLSMDRLGRCNKLSFYETVPIRINPNGKIIDEVDFYRYR